VFRKRWIEDERGGAVSLQLHTQPCHRVEHAFEWGRGLIAEVGAAPRVVGNVQVHVFKPCGGGEFLHHGVVQVGHGGLLVYVYNVALVACSEQSGERQGRQNDVFHYMRGFKC